MEVFARFAKAIESAFPAQEGAPPQTWIVALSGGLDSSVLLELCTRYRSEFRPSQSLVAAHLHHGLRGEDADRDQAFCRQACEEREVPFRTLRQDVQGLARSASIGLEEAGRQARHTFLADLCDAYAPAVALLAHHADDQVETIIMNARRGAHLRGLAGMRPHKRFSVNDLQLDIFRPLLEIPKAALLAYATDRQVCWQEDRTNLDLAFTRNQIRHGLLPDLEERSPALRPALLTFSRSMRTLEDRLVAEAERFVAENATFEERGIRLQLNHQTCRDPALALTAVRQLLENELGAGELNTRVYTSLSRLICEGRTGSELHVACGVRVYREADGLFLSPRPLSPEPNDASQLLPPVPFATHILGVHVQATRLLAPGPMPEQDRKDPNVQWLDEDSLAGGLLLRRRMPGDRFQALGAPGTRKVKKLLIDLKVPRHERSQALILADTNGILWVWPHRLGHRPRITDATRSVLRLRIAPQPVPAF